MSFLHRNSQSTAAEQAFVPEPSNDTKLSHHVSIPDYFPLRSSLHKGAKVEGGEGISLGGTEDGELESQFLRAKANMASKEHVDVSPEEGGILIPSRKLPEHWHKVPDLSSIRNFDRDFIFPGEQLHILVHVSRDDQMVTPFKLAAVVGSSGNEGQRTGSGKHDLELECESSSRESYNSSDENRREVLEDIDESVDHTDTQQHVYFSESFLKMEGQKKRISILKESFRNSHFLVRISQSDGAGCIKGNPSNDLVNSSRFLDGKNTAVKPDNIKFSKNGTSAVVVEEGIFNPDSASGVARNVATCCSLSNADVMVILPVTVVTDAANEAMVEVLQFEKYQCTPTCPILNRSNGSFHIQQYAKQDLIDPCKELLQWLLPLDRPSLHPVVSSLSQPSLSSSSFSVRSSPKPSAPGTSSTLFSFGNFRSYSSVSLTNSNPVHSNSSKSSSANFNLESWGQSASEKVSQGHEARSIGLLSFRGVSLEPQRFSGHCGLEGLYVPGKRWKKKVEIIQPIEIESYFADINAEEFVCVTVKNVISDHLPDVIFFVDSISIICDVVAVGSPPVSIPISCIETGNDHAMPGLALRREEQHSFILKPTAVMHKLSGTDQEDKNQFAILVSCRCSHTESRVLFKHSMQWQPRTPADLLISVESEIGGPSVSSDGSIPQLSAQVLALHATNLSENNINLTLLAPTSTTSPECVFSTTVSAAHDCTNSPLTSNDADDEGINAYQRSCSASFPSLRPLSAVSGIASSNLKDTSISVADIMADNNLSYTHLWLQSTVPLGCIPANSTKTVRLELLPLTDGIITLDTILIVNKDRGTVYIPEKSLKIFSTSGITSGIM